LYRRPVADPLLAYEATRLSALSLDRSTADLFGRDQFARSAALVRELCSALGQGFKLR
jgi:hypothetical protein